MLAPIFDKLGRSRKCEQFCLLKTAEGFKLFVKGLKLKAFVKVDDDDGCLR